MASEADEDFQASLPRSAVKGMDGSDLRIVGRGAKGEAIITDGERVAPYEPMEGQPPLDGELRIVPAYVEAGWFTEANCVTLTDGERRAVYVPVGQPGLD